MIRKNTLIVAAALSLLVLAGCGRTVEDQTDEAVKSAQEVFEMNPKQPTEFVDGLEFYKPIGWKSDVQKDEHAFILTKGNQSFTAEFDVNAKQDSHAFYELLTTDTSKNIIQQQTFTDSGAFGFVVVSEHGDSAVEVVTGAGPAQVTAIVDRGHLVTATERMMEIARSVEIDSQ